MFEKIIEMTIKMAFFIPRPYVVNNQPTFVVFLPTDSTFFSGHTAMATVLATVIFFKYKRLGIALLIISIIIGTARVFANVHYPIDIISGLIFGVTIGVSCGKIEAYARYHHPTSGKSKKREK